MNTAAIASHLNVADSAIVEVQEWARVLWVRVKGLGARFVSKKVAAVNLTEKQEKAWDRVHTYDGHGYHVEIGAGKASGYFNSQCGQYVSRFNFAYSPLSANSPDPDKFRPDAHGWLGVLGMDSTFDEVPAFPHPNELYQWLREEFGYKRTVITRA